MALLNKVDARTVIEDARLRQTARVALMQANETKAMLLLRLYMTVGIATASGSLALLTQQRSVSIALGWALLAATLVAIAGAAFCLLASRQSDINLPGRDADFWERVAHDDVTAEHAVLSYLRDLQKGIEVNRAVNLKNAKTLLLAQWCAVILPLAALLAGAAALYRTGWTI
jgi:hypothetical protein